MWQESILVLVKGCNAIKNMVPNFFDTPPIDIGICISPFSHIPETK